MCLEVADSLRKHLVADTRRQSLQLVEPTGPMGERVEHDQVQLAADDVQRGSRRAAL